MKRTLEFHRSQLCTRLCFFWFLRLTGDALVTRYQQNNPCVLELGDKNINTRLCLLDYYLELHEIPAPSSAVRWWPGCSLVTWLLFRYHSSEICDEDISSLAGSCKAEDSFWFCLYRFSVVRCSLLIKLALGITRITGSIRSIFWDFLKGLDDDFTDHLNRWDSKVSTNNSNKQVTTSLWCSSIVTWTPWEAFGVEENL